MDVKNLSVIAPPKVLNFLSEQCLDYLGDWHLLLSHFALENGDYLNFYQERAENGDTVVVDNSVIELKQPLMTPDIYKVAKEIENSLLVLPDVLYERAVTHKMSQEGIRYLYKVDFPPNRIMAVIQGKNLDDVCRSIDAYVDDPLFEGVKHFAIPKALEPVVDGGRAKIVQELVSRQPFIGMKIHLLGFTEPAADCEALWTHDAVRGIDSTVPVRLAMQGHLCYPDGSMPIRPKGDPSFLTWAMDEDDELLKCRILTNIEAARMWLGVPVDYRSF